MTEPSTETDDGTEPRWPALVAIVAAALLPFALPRSMSVAPPWVLATAVAGLAVGAVLARRAGKHRVNEWLGYASLVVLTGAMVFSLAQLVSALPRHAESASALLSSAAVIWVTNVIVFASWYWRVDAGGPNARDRRTAHTRGAFLFPQMAIMAPGSAGQSVAEAENWRPGFIDYLALAFYTSTAFSPTDVPVLSGWAKLAMMLQSLISFGTIVLLASRAVNIF